MRNNIRYCDLTPASKARAEANASEYAEALLDLCALIVVSVFLFILCAWVLL